MCLDNMMHLLMMPPFNPLIKSLPTHTACLKFQFDVVGVEVFNKVYGGRVGLHVNDLMTDVALSFATVFRKALKVVPHLLSPFLPHFSWHILLDKTSFWI